MAGETQTAATLDDLRREEGKAELVGGRIVHLMPTGFRPGKIVGLIYMSLHAHAAPRPGTAWPSPDNVLGTPCRNWHLVASRFRRMLRCSQAPCRRTTWTSWEGPRPWRSRSGVRETTVPGPRSNAAKRADYFGGGTQVVWDVDPRARVIRSHRAGRLRPVLGVSLRTGCRRRASGGSRVAP